VTYREGYILQGTGPYDPKGISLSGRNTITIENFGNQAILKAHFLGVYTPLPNILFFLWISGLWRNLLYDRD